MTWGVDFLFGGPSVPDVVTVTELSERDVEVEEKAYYRVRDLSEGKRADFQLRDGNLVSVPNGSYIHVDDWEDYRVERL